MVEITTAPEEEEEEEETSSSSSPAGDEYHHHHGWKYDVFLSFRGEDTRKHFVDHLYSALQRSGIHTFKDDRRLETGESISPALLKAIEDSMFAVVVFSKNYASSRWCLDELVKIMDCRRLTSKSSIGLGPQTVFPIFYDVQPSEVRKPDEGYFGEILIRKHDPPKVEMWRKALGEAANLSGLELKNTAHGHESKFIEVIVEKIWRKLRSTILSGSEGLVGMKSRIEAVTSLLDVESNVVRTVGIWGLSGIGKSTLAGAIYNKIKSQFDAAHFLENVGETSKKDGLKHLQENLLSETLGVKDLQITNAREGIALMKTRLCSTRVLLVLDDVESLEQLEALAGSHDWFGPGSRIMITTRDKQLLVAHNVDKIHEASVLEDVEATKLFHWTTFNAMRPTRDFEELSIQVTQYAGGLPLALKIFGSALRNRGIVFWDSALVKLRKDGPEGEIVDKLKIGFDGLDEAQKDTFLEIACFFKGKEKEHVKRKLDSFEFYPNTSIPVLVGKSLIYCSDGTVHMHQLIREMGRRIVRKDFPREPGKHSRLWDTEEIELVLANSTGTENIQGIILNPCGRERVIEMGSEAFRKMTNLRLLEIYNSSLRRGPEYLSNMLQWIVWHKYPSSSLPTTFEAYNLVGLQLPFSSIKQLWKGRKVMDKLKYINLAHSQKLIETPDFTGTPNLEELILEDCTSLVVVHQSLGALKRLVCLDLGGCSNLKSLPNSIHSECLQTFKLGWCESLQKFPEIPVIMEDLLELFLERTTIRELPSSIEHLPNLVLLYLVGCKNLASLPSTVCKLKRLKRLNLSKCSKLDKLPEDLGYLECLEQLDLDKTTIKEVPSSIEHLSSSLVHLSMSQCKNIQSFPSAICKLKHLKYLNLSGCSELDKLSEELGNLECLVELNLAGTTITQPPLSIRCLNKLEILTFRKCSQSSTSSAFPFWFPWKRKRQEEEEEDFSTRSLVLLSVLGLHSLLRLDISGCNMLDGAIPSDFESLCSLKELYLSGNCFVELPSLNQLSRLSELYLDGCNMLKALPELPSSIDTLSADDCRSLRLSADRFTNTNNLSEVSFRDCLQLLEEDNGESKNIVASTLWQHMIHRPVRGLSMHFYLSIILPGRDIPEWFCKHQTMGNSISLKLPSNWSIDNLKGFGFCVAFDPRYKAMPFPFTFHGRGKKVAGVRVEIMFRTCSNRQHQVPVSEYFIIGREKNISGEHLCLAYTSFDDDYMHVICETNDWCEMEFSIKYSSPNSAAVTKWGVCLVPKSRGLKMR